MAATPWRVDGPVRAVPAPRDVERLLFRRPSPHYPTFTAWLCRIIEDLIIGDASAVSMGGRGNGLSLDLVDPAVIEPACDPHGKVRGFVQYDGEVPRRTLAEIAAGPAPGGVPLLGHLPGRFIYLARRPDAAAGRSPLERAIAREPDGGVDLAETEAWLRWETDEGWAAGCMSYLADRLFGEVLARISPGLRWKWETDG